MINPVLIHIPMKFYFRKYMLKKKNTLTVENLFKLHRPFLLSKYVVEHLLNLKQNNLRVNKAPQTDPI